MELVVNMKKKYLFLLAIVLVFVTGCSNVSYDLDVYLNSFEEKLSLEHGGSDMPSDLDVLIEDNVNNMPSLKGGKVDYNVTNSEIEITHQFDDIHFIERSEMIKTLYDKVIITQSDNLTTVRLQGYNNTRFVCGEFDEGCLLTLDNITFTLSSEYQIVSSNANSINERKNQHTWVFTSQNKDEFYFSYSDEIRWDVVVRNFITKHSTLLVVGGIMLLIAIVLLVFVGIFIRKNKENNS